MLDSEPWWYVINESGLLIKEDNGEKASLPSSEDIQKLGLDQSKAKYIGSLGKTKCLVIKLSDQWKLPPRLAIRSLHSLVSRLEADRFQFAGRALQLVHFESTHKFCGQCAASLEQLPNEYGKRCPQCKLVTYPRLSPAVIVLVVRGKEALLARSSSFPPALYSTLAGFVEPGESLEDTVFREIREEVGIEVKNLRYFGSQPWPFPHSLMVGFFAEYDRGDISVDGQEIVDAGWYHRDKLPQIPPKITIARHLIDAWIQMNPY